MKLLKIEDYSNQELWDIEVEDSHCYFANGILVHNSNASCVYNVADETLTAQSRTRELSPLSDNYGFCAFMLKNETLIKDLCETILRDYDTYNTVVIYGEWFGKGINSGCAIHQLDRKFAIFGIRLLNENSNKWIDGIDLREMFTKIDIDSFFFTNDGITLQKLNDNDIYCITQFGIWVIDIDFNHPELVQNKIINITNKIEEECPVGKFFGVSGTGEGVVFSHNGEHFYQFKSKGSKFLEKVPNLIGITVPNDIKFKIIEFSKQNNTNHLTFEFD